jgi:hypothetical protein
MFRFQVFLPAVVSLAFAIGCNSDPGSVPVDVPPAEVQLKAALNDVAETGELGSGEDYIESLVADLSTTNPSKAAELDPQLQELKAARTPAQVKMKARTMAEKL